MTAIIEKIMLGTREITVLLPPAYAKGKENFAVAYIHDGGDLLYKQLAAVTELMAGGKLAQIIFVGIAAEQRLDDYTPWPAAALAAGYRDFGGKGDQYLAFVVNEVKPYIDRKYRTSTSPEHTGIIGASLGGLISLYALYLYPDIFGKFGSISGSFWYEGFIEFMKENRLLNKKSRIYMDVGSREGAGKNNIQREMLIRTGEVYNQLLEQGLPAANCRYWISEGDMHGQLYFMQRFPAALNWLYPLK
jgi:predicted alpha/beta superfamily hydrolase